MSISKQQIQTIYDSLPQPIKQHQIDSGLILGSGLGHLIEQFDVLETLPYSKITGFPHSTAPTHQGQLTIAQHQQHTVAIFQGRFHLYEGWTAAQTTLPVYLLKAMGAKQVIISNAAGGLNPDIPVASVMLIEDHINLTGQNPLVGNNDDQLGVRFPDMSQAYNTDLRNTAINCAEQCNIKLERGIYVGVTGPSFETNAERRFLNSIGGDAVGMSTIMEVIAANHCQLPVLAFSVITNGATGLADQQADSLEEAIKNATLGGQTLVKLLLKFIF